MPIEVVRSVSKKKLEPFTPANNRNPRLGIHKHDGAGYLSGGRHSTVITGLPAGFVHFAFR